MDFHPMDEYVDYHYSEKERKELCDLYDILAELDKTALDRLLSIAYDTGRAEALAGEDI